MRALLTASRLRCHSIDCSLTNLRSGPYWKYDRLQECCNRRRHKYIDAWQSFKYDKMYYAARADLYDPCNADFVRMEPAGMLSMVTLPFICIERATRCEVRPRRKEPCD